MMCDLYMELKLVHMNYTSSVSYLIQSQWNHGIIQKNLPYHRNQTNSDITNPSPCSSHQKQSGNVSIRHALPHFRVDFSIISSNSRSINISFFPLYSFRQTESSTIAVTNPLLPCTTAHEMSSRSVLEFFKYFPFMF